MELGTFKTSHRPQQPPRYPTIRVDHNRASFVTPNDAGVLDLRRELTFIGLGLLRERAMWPRDEQRAVFGNRPLCKSGDAVTGAPGLHFPWHDYENPAPPAADGSRPKADAIPCDGCNFRAWNGREQPQCQQTWVIPALVVATSPGAPMVNPETVRLLQFSASGIRELEAYLKPYRDQGRPMYETVTKVQLQKVSKGGRNYASPKFTSVASTDPEYHGLYSFFLREVREYLAPKSDAPKLIGLPLYPK